MQNNNVNIMNKIKGLFRKDPVPTRKDLGIIDFSTMEILAGRRKLVDLNDLFTEPVKVSVAGSDGHYSITKTVHMPSSIDGIGVVYIGSQGWKTITEGLCPIII